jgi:hypothetical protein
MVQIAIIQCPQQDGVKMETYQKKKQWHWWMPIKENVALNLPKLKNRTHCRYNPQNSKTMDAISNRLSNQQLEDQFTTAYESGSSGWCGLSNEELQRIRAKFRTEELRCPAEYLWDAILAGESIEFYDQEDEDETWVMNLEKVKEGTEKMFAEHTEHYTDALNECGDAITADVWFQLCLMNDVVFG